MATLFSETLIQFRKEAGFKTAYRFYHDNGGKPFFKISYRMCLLMEQGKRMPAFKILGLYIYALRLPPLSSAAAEFTLAWLKTAHGKEEIEQLVVPYLKIEKSHPIASPFHKALKKEIAKRTFHITPAQVAVFNNSRVNYFCWTALANDIAAWKPKDLAAQLKLPVPDVTKAMRELAAVKLLKVKNGAYQCPMAGGVIETPQMLVEHQRKKSYLRVNEIISSGKPVFVRHGVLRASAMELHNVFPLLTLNVATMDSYAVTEKQKDSALFGIETKVVKIRDF
ncbi:MAG: hypothetical protein AB7V08_13485 [Elusimicrobiales bacterium]